MKPRFRFGPSSRRFWILAALVGGFLLLDLALFAWLSFQSLSQRELDRVLLETRQEAREIAGRLQRTADATAGDLFAAVARDQETQSYVDSMLRQRPIVRTVEITDRNGVLVMRERQPSEPAASGGDAELAGELASLDVTVPIGGHGSLRVGLSAPEMSRRIGDLRRALLRQTFTLGGLTALLVGVAVAVIASLLRRGERLESQAAEAERLAYVGTLAAGLAHEIRNPLNSLNLNMQMLEEDLRADGAGDSGRRVLAVTRAEIARLERLVSEFLAYARPRPLLLADVAAIDLLLGAREVLAAQIAQRDDVEVRIVDESEEALVHVDEEQIRQLLLNLLQNALAATEDTGRRGHVLLLARREGQRVELAVHDNGRGIPPAERARIFDAFYSTRKAGTGLGLAIAERIARAHHGTLTCDSDFGYGSRFVLSLPLAAGDAAPAE